jgi:hypothetical protein
VSESMDGQLAELWRKLTSEVELTGDQHDLLKAIFEIAFDVTSRADDPLACAFNGSFEPGQARLILAYRDGSKVTTAGRVFGDAQRSVGQSDIPGWTVTVSKSVGRG